MDEANFSPPAQPWGQPPVAPPSLRPIDFVSEGRKFLKLLVRGAALQLVTFGFYRFWLATDIRRHLWSHSMIDGENAEYTGTGRELLIGFLFALAILVPIYLVYFLIGIEAERVQAFASVPLGLFMVLFASFAAYRARRYRLTRTVWRGVRFWMQGSGWKFAFIAFGWMILVVLSLGGAWPWRAAALERYKMRNTFYGDMPADFDARPIEFFKKGLGMWLFAIISLIFLAAGGILSTAAFKAPGSGVVLMVLGTIGLIAVPFMYPFFRALEWRWWASGVNFGGTRLECNLRGGALLGLFFKYLVIAWLVASVVAMLIIAIGAAVVEAAGIQIKSLNPQKLNELMSGETWILVAGAAFGYLTIMLAAGVVQRFFLQHEYWRVITSTITIVRPEAMENVAAKGDIANALGEGLADGFDIAGF